MTGLIQKLLLVLAVITGAFGLGLGISYWQQQQLASVEFSHCEQLQNASCEWQVADQQWQLQLPTNSLPAMLVQQIQLSTSQSNPPPLMLSLQGVEMYMGEVSISLEPNDNGLYQADLLLPICNTGKMRWRAEIVSLDPKRPVALSFEVDSQ
ncbi:MULTISPECIES: hypothetical protein [unclassified Agarivorans]|uniref:hypothetical protein n=1 Tax=unclassified Agarivorans TaxID=2636026 RepID=UPI0026E2D21A|nr:MULTISPECIES: hypothetical protein [unclassified Agarivorans]MDO6685340.1 hypothetical protein [Agarivorans sp. 3_MG-2023]MDO6715488.1 hypothetical protein [Agarivorans sp. 2_MG-2023]